MTDRNPADWNPGLYRRFEDARTRPARDLLAQVPTTGVGDGGPAARVFDLGCGPGNSTELLAARYPQAAIVGVDNSPAMIAAARERLPGCRFDLADAATWQPDGPADLLFANASLHWVPDHATLLPRLLRALAPGGMLAVQMPDNLDEPSHRLMREVAADGPWASRLAGAAGERTTLLSPDGYHDLLAPLGAVDVWRTTYHHPLADPAAIVDWLRGSGLRPFIDPLPAGERAAFLADYERRIDRAYPRRADGLRLLAFPRLFIVARRGA